MINKILVRVAARLRAGQALAFRLAARVFLVVGRIRVITRRKTESLLSATDVNGARLIQLHQDWTEISRRRAYDQDRDLLRLRRRADDETGFLNPAKLFRRSTTRCRRFRDRERRDKVGRRRPT